jgi:hypothetical protein
MTGLPPLISRLRCIASTRRRRVPMRHRYQREIGAMPICHSRENRQRFFGTTVKCPMEATEYNHRGHKAFATSRPRGMRILSPAGRFGRLRLPPGCRPDRPHITPIRRLICKPRRRPSPLLSPQPLVFRLGRGARRSPRVAAESEIHAKVADRSASILFARPTQRVSMHAVRMTGLPPLISHL